MKKLEAITAALIVMMQLGPFVGAQPTKICYESSPVYTGAYGAPADPKIYEFKFSDNRESILEFQWFVTPSATNPLLLRSWRIYYKEQASGTTKNFLFGLLKLGHISQRLTLDNLEITQFATFIDEEDIEGFRFVFEDGTLQDYRANYDVVSAPLVLKGRPVGFKATFGTNIEGTADQPLSVQIIYNTCMCPLSYFLAQAPLDNMRITADVDKTAVNQLISQFRDRVNTVYGQNCGGYRLEIQPSLSFLSIESISGAKPHQVKLKPTSSANVGVYQVDLVVINTGGYQLPEPGFLPESRYPFQVTVDPCPITEADISASPAQTLIYKIGEAAISSSPYSFIQGPTPCSHPSETTVVSVPPLPAFITHDAATKTINIAKTRDNSYAPQTYEVQVKYTVTYQNQAADPSSVTQIVKTVRITINLEVGCIATRLSTSTVFPSPVEYTLGKAGFDLAFLFDHEPAACPFDITFTLTGVPNMMLLVLDQSPLRVNQSFDLTQRGVYPSARITATIAEPGFGPPLIAFLDFVVHVNPCPITDFVPIPASLGTVTYTLGDPGFIFSYTGFQQSLSCGYIEQETLVGSIPDTAILQYFKDTNSFSVNKSEDRSLAGNYPMEIKATIDVPDDLLSNPTIRRVSANISLKFIVIDPCATSSLNPFTVDNMSTSVLESPPALQDLKTRKPQDTVSFSLGPKDGFTYCGDRQFEIETTGLSPLLTYNYAAQTLTLQSTRDLDVGVRTVRIASFLVSYPSVRTTTEFLLTITACRVLTLTPQTTPNQVYTLAIPSSVKSVAVTPFLQSPICSTGISYSIALVNPVTGVKESLPSWITNSPAGSLTLSLSSSDQSISGTHKISVTGSVPSSAMSLETQFEIEVFPADCVSEFVSPDGTLGPFDYVLGSGVLALQPTWTSSVDFFVCPAKFAIYLDVGGAWVSPVPAAQAPALNFKPINGFLDIETSDLALDGQTWRIRLTKESIYSQAPQNGLIGPLGMYLIDITFVDPCWLATLTPPTFSAASLTFTLFELQHFSFTHMQVGGTGNCGGPTHELMYVAGPLLSSPLGPIVDLSQYYTISGSSQSVREVTGTVKDRIWLGVHTLMIKGTNGAPDSTTNARGRKGLFLSALSTPLSLNITDPCVDTVINGNAQFKLKEALETPVGQSMLEQRVQGPSDSMSQLYATTGYGMCGPMLYDLVLAGEVKPPNVKFEVQRRTGMADTLQFEVNSQPYGNEIRVRATLTVSLIGYPEARHASFETEFVWRECKPKDFSAPLIQDQLVAVGDPAKSLDAKFDQSPCEYAQAYEIVLWDAINSSFVVAPDFMSYNDVTLQFVLSKTEVGDVGRYEVVIRSKLSNWTQSTQSVRFFVQVFLKKDEYVFLLKPLWETRLENQVVKLGESLEYTPAIRVVPNGYNYTLKVHLNVVAAFGRYDSLLNKLRLEPRETENYLGSFQVDFVADFFNGTDFARFSQSIVVTVWSPSQPNPGPGGVRPVDYPEWPREPEDSLKPFPGLGEAPVPRILSLSDSGLLRLGWDSLMSVPGEYEKIPDEKVAVKDWSALDIDERDERLQIGFYEPLGRKPALQLALIEALEIRLLYQDPEWTQRRQQKVKFKVVDYGSRTIDIQLYFAQPELIGSDSAADTLSVTFWGTKFFINTQNREVAYGTELRTPVFRQISPEEAQVFEKMIEASWPSVFFICCVCIVGAQLPTWMFINSLSLIVHTTLLNSLMPPAVCFVFKRYLNLVRLTWSELNQNINERFGETNYSNEDGLYSIYLGASDYNHLFARNLVIFMAFAALIVAVWIILAIIDLATVPLRGANLKSSRSGKGRKEPLCNNFALRFFYELLLELLICALVNVALPDFETASPSIQWILSVLFLALVAVYVAWLVSLFFWNGPYLHGFYVTGTSVQSYWSARPIDVAFGASEKAARQEALRRRALWRAAKKRAKLWKLKMTAKIAPAEAQQDQSWYLTERPFLLEKIPLVTQTEVSQEVVQNGVASDLSLDPPSQVSAERKRRLLSATRPGAGGECVLSSVEDDQATSRAGDLLSQPLHTMSTKLISDNFIKIQGDSGSPKRSNELASDMTPTNAAATLQSQMEGPGALKRKHKYQRLDTELLLRKIFKDPEDQSFARQIVKPRSTQHATETDGPVRLAQIVGDSQSHGASKIDADPLCRVVAKEKTRLPEEIKEFPDEHRYDDDLEEEAQRLDQLEGGETDQVTSIQVDSSPPLLTNQEQLKLERKKMIEETAREIAAGIDLIKKPARFKTIYYGLKMNHPRNVSLVHPLMFAIRRIIYALSVVLIPTWPLMGPWIMLAVTLIMLGYALVEFQWQHSLINNQHIFNEIVTYVVCVHLLLFTNFVGAETRVTLGYLLLAVFASFLAYNAIIMLIFLCVNTRLWLRRLVTWTRRKKLQAETDLVLSELRQSLNLSGHNKDDAKAWFVPDELDCVWEPDYKPSKTGGAICVITLTKRTALHRIDESESSLSNNWSREDCMAEDARAEPERPEDRQLLSVVCERSSDEKVESQGSKSGSFSEKFSSHVLSEDRRAASQYHSDQKHSARESHSEILDEEQYEVRNDQALLIKVTPVPTVVVSGEVSRFSERRDSLQMLEISNAGSEKGEEQVAERAWFEPDLISSKEQEMLLSAVKFASARRQGSGRSSSDQRHEAEKSLNDKTDSVQPRAKRVILLDKIDSLLSKSLLVFDSDTEEVLVSSQETFHQKKPVQEPHTSCLNKSDDKEETGEPVVSARGEDAGERLANQRGLRENLKIMFRQRSLERTQNRCETHEESGAGLVLTQQTAVNADEKQQQATKTRRLQPKLAKIIEDVGTNKTNSQVRNVYPSVTAHACEAAEIGMQVNDDQKVDSDKIGGDTVDPFLSDAIQPSKILSKSVHMHRPKVGSIKMNIAKRKSQLGKQDLLGAPDNGHRRIVHNDSESQALIDILSGSLSPKAPKRLIATQKGRHEDSYSLRLREVQQTHSLIAKNDLAASSEVCSRAQSKFVGFLERPESQYIVLQTRERLLEIPKTSSSLPRTDSVSAGKSNDPNDQKLELGANRSSSQDTQRNRVFNINVKSQNGDEPDDFPFYVDHRNLQRVESQFNQPSTIDLIKSRPRYHSQELFEPMHAERNTAPPLVTREPNRETAVDSHTVRDSASSMRHMASALMAREDPNIFNTSRVNIQRVLLDQKPGRTTFNHKLPEQNFGRAAFSYLQTFKQPEVNNLMASNSPTHVTRSQGSERNVSPTSRFARQHVSDLHPIADKGPREEVFIPRQSNCRVALSKIGASNANQEVSPVEQLADIQEAKRLKRTSKNHAVNLSQVKLPEHDNSRQLAFSNAGMSVLSSMRSSVVATPAASQFRSELH